MAWADGQLLPPCLAVLPQAGPPSPLVLSQTFPPMSIHSPSQPQVEPSTDLTTSGGLVPPPAPLFSSPSSASSASSASSVSGASFVMGGQKPALPVSSPADQFDAAFRVDLTATGCPGAPSAVSAATVEALCSLFLSSPSQPVGPSRLTRSSRPSRPVQSPGDPEIWPSISPTLDPGIRPEEVVAASDGGHMSGLDAQLANPGAGLFSPGRDDSLASMGVFTPNVPASSLDVGLSPFSAHQDSVVSSAQLPGLQVPPHFLFLPSNEALLLAPHPSSTNPAFATPHMPNFCRHGNAETGSTPAHYVYPPPLAVYSHHQPLHSTHPQAQTALSVLNSLISMATVAAASASASASSSLSALATTPVSGLEATGVVGPETPRKRIRLAEPDEVDGRYEANVVAQQPANQSIRCRQVEHRTNVQLAELADALEAGAGEPTTNDYKEEVRRSRDLERAEAFANTGIIVCCKP
ncbi:unnamed protein product [Protopolystoma xenopodis]|uniref:Uncharacterized protein n=1 Tax=Protopolystoma xenopodis TaxID=117903 RepID=A0A448XK36_9PLAT|nr:unnamed protein product [Protopolystoma xenopodis]